MAQEFKTVASFKDSMRAEIAATKLRANNVDAEIFNDNSPFPGMVGNDKGVVVKVRTGDYDRAKKLLDEDNIK